MPLSVKQLMTLDFEREHAHAATAAANARKELAIRETFGEHPAAYYQRLAWLSRQPEAEEYAVDVVTRLRRLHEARSAWRRTG